MAGNVREEEEEEGERSTESARREKRRERKAAVFLCTFLVAVVFSILLRCMNEQQHEPLTRTKLDEYTKWPKVYGRHCPQSPTSTPSTPLWCRNDAHASTYLWPYSIHKCLSLCQNVQCKLYLFIMFVSSHALIIQLKLKSVSFRIYCSCSCS